jgi:hypothetical protein
MTATDIEGSSVRREASVRPAVCNGNQKWTQQKFEQTHTTSRNDNIEFLADNISYSWDHVQAIPFWWVVQTEG